MSVLGPDLTTVTWFKVLTVSPNLTRVSGSFLPQTLINAQHTGRTWNLELNQKSNLIEGATLSNKWTLSENSKTVYT